MPETGRVWVEAAEIDLGLYTTDEDLGSGLGGDKWRGSGGGTVGRILTESSRSGGVDGDNIPALSWGGSGIFSGSVLIADSCSRRVLGVFGEEAWGGGDDADGAVYRSGSSGDNDRLQSGRAP